MNTFELSQGQGHKLEKAVARNNGTTKDIEWLCNGDNFKHVIYLARRDASLERKEAAALKVEPLINTLICVDRSVKPVYPDWMEKVIHPELEAQGLGEYDLSKVEQWLHDGQKGGKWVEGNKIYARLKENDNELLKTCLTLRDGEEIQKNGIEAFRKFFMGKALFLWGSVVQHRDGNLRVPCLCAGGDRVVFDWNWLGHVWNGCHPTGRHTS